MVIGQMVVAYGDIGRIADISDGVATVQIINLDGAVRISIAPVASLATLWDATRPRAVWPVSGDLDVLIEQQQERERIALRKTERQARERVARKAGRRGYRKSAA